MISQGNPPESAPKLMTHPYVGVAGVLLGAMIATCTGRLMSVGMSRVPTQYHQVIASNAGTK
jgi:MFS transporter, DHA2 family, multidrug resistance protein